MAHLGCHRVRPGSVTAEKAAIGGRLGDSVTVNESLIDFATTIRNVAVHCPIEVRLLLLG